MRKDLMLVAALSALAITPLQADPGGNSTSQVGNNRAPIHGSRVEESGEVTDKNAAPVSITGEVTNSGDRGSSAAQNFNGETPGTLGARGTIGQDGTGFTGQERIGTLPPGRLGFYKTNDFDKKLNRPDQSVIEPSQRVGNGLPFDPSGAGGPGSTQIGRASQLDPASTTPDTATNHQSRAASKTGAGAVTPADSGPAGLAGSAGRYNGQPLTPGSQTSAELGHETVPIAERPQTKPPTPAQGAPAPGAQGSASSDAEKVVPPDNSNPKSGLGSDHSVQPNNTSEDRQMSNRIRRQLMNTASPGSTAKLTPKQLQHVRVKAANGEVTLSGSVSTPNEKREIEARVKEMRGVSGVKNQLTIKGAGSTTDNTPTTSK